MSIDLCDEQIINSKAIEVKINEGPDPNGALLTFAKEQLQETI